jgi:hypothetical protein
MQNKGIHVKCPVPGCNNRRLFDVFTTAQGIVEIKCNCCKKLAVIDLQRVVAGKKYLGIYE